MDRPGGYRSYPYLGTGQVLENRHGPSVSGGDAPDSRNDLTVIGVGAMGEVQPGNVHSGLDQTFQNGR